MVTKFNNTIFEGFPEVRISNFQYPSVNWKYASLRHVLDHETTNETLRDIISQAPLIGNHKRILVDVKVQNLEPSQTSCIPGWHLDGPGNPLHPSSKERHHLYIHEEGGETEFIAEAFYLNISQTMSMKEIVDMIPDGLPVMKVKPRRFTSFTRFDFHRGINVAKPMKRLLVRLTETDVIKPNNVPYTGAVGSK